MKREPYGPGSGAPKLYRYGNELSRDEQGLVLMAWESRRYTENRTPQWVIIEQSRGRLLPPQFVDDMDWLSHTQFVVTLNGKLDRRTRECREEPTWPTRPDLRGAPLAMQAHEAPNLRYIGWARDYQTERAELATQEAEDERDARAGLRRSAEENKRRLALGLPTLGEEEIFNEKRAEQGLPPLTLEEIVKVWVPPPRD